MERYNSFLYLTLVNQVALYNDKSSEKLVETHQRTYLQQAVVGISESAIIELELKL